MTRSRPITFLAGAVVVPLAALAVAACGGGAAATASPPASSSTTKTAPTKTAPTKTATIRVANSRLGRILVDSTGRTLYLFKADSGTSSACSGACAVAWPPLRTGATPAVASGANAALVGTIARSDGARQVTYNGHPLYLFVKDQKPGDVNGEGLTAFGGVWLAVSAAGNQVSSRPTGHGSGSSSSRPAASAAPPAANPRTAPKPAPQPAPKSAPKPPVAKPAPPASNGIPQNNGGDGDLDNNGGPSDGDGNI
jgi:predicted lipoprotein with Yx(FWY)xxD motif